MDDDGPCARMPTSSQTRFLTALALTRDFPVWRRSNSPKYYLPLGLPKVPTSLLLPATSSAIFARIPRPKYINFCPWKFAFSHPFQLEDGRGENFKVMEALVALLPTVKGLARGIYAILFASWILIALILTTFTVCYSLLNGILPFAPIGLLIFLFCKVICALHLSSPTARRIATAHKASSPWRLQFILYSISWLMAIAFYSSLLIPATYYAAQMPYSEPSTLADRSASGRLRYCLDCILLGLYKLLNYAAILTLRDAGTEASHEVFHYLTYSVPWFVRAWVWFSIATLILYLLAHLIPIAPKNRRTPISGDREPNSQDRVPNFEDILNRWGGLIQEIMEAAHETEGLNGAALLLMASNMTLVKAASALKGAGELSSEQEKGLVTELTNMNDTLLSLATELLQGSDYTKAKAE
ncbi:hypothetical protein QBC46DRAFT_414711 [Diplogelasinospora grovesii]|uniref:Uncharacterized protein n=1 Tax=Diplogelasinospora grovesii TaxID=303347 RepID=A0AAN6RYJ6_9PEZI|nr:hypothetical protein QBC46DRAFT_414711 [Diplogelasinospora grovesii]